MLLNAKSDGCSYEESNATPDNCSADHSTAYA